MEELEENYKSKKKFKKKKDIEDDESFDISSFGSSHAKCVFSIEDIDDDFIVLKDQSAVFGGKTITNSAEEVIVEIRKFLENRNRTVYYIDSNGRKSQILYDQNLKFTGFRV